MVELLYPFLLPYTFAAPVHGVLELIQVADLGGQETISFLIVTCNVSIAHLMLLFVRQDFPNYKQYIANIFPGATLLLLSLAYSYLRVQAIDRKVMTSIPVTAGIVQAGMDPFSKHRDPDEVVRRHVRMTKAIIREQSPDFIVWSESAVMTPIPEYMIKYNLSQKLGGDLNRPIILGAIIRDGKDTSRLSNSILVSGGDGYVCPDCRYDKQVLIPFTEVFTIGALREELSHIGSLKAGEQERSISLRKHNIAAFICYESLFPGLVRKLVISKEAHLLVNLANDGWFGDTAEPFVHLALSKLRAVEHRRYLVRGTTSGFSAVVDPVGRVVARTGLNQETTLVSKVAWLSDNTLFGALGSCPWGVLSILCLLYTIIMKRRRHALSKK